MNRNRLRLTGSCVFGFNSNEAIFITIFTDPITDIYPDYRPVLKLNEKIYIKTKILVQHMDQINFIGLPIVARCYIGALHYLLRGVGVWWEQGGSNNQGMQNIEKLISGGREGGGEISTGVWKRIEN